MKTALDVVRAGCALIAMSMMFGVAGAAVPIHETPQMTLMSTDTTEPYPFAAIVVNHKTYHVTEGDILDGIYIRHIGPGRVTLSNDHVLIAAQQPQRESMAYQVPHANVH